MRFQIHGYGGQGVKTAARILSRSGVVYGFNAQWFITSFEEAEPTVAYVRFAKEKILEKGPTADSDFTLVFHRDDMPQIKDLKDGSVLILNSQEKLVNPKLKKKKIKAYTVDATGIALSATGKSYPNTVMLGALLKYFTKIPMKNLKSAIESELKEKQKENILAAEEGYKQVR